MEAVVLFGTTTEGTRLFLGNLFSQPWLSYCPIFFLGMYKNVCWVGQESEILIFTSGMSHETEEVFSVTKVAPWRIFFAPIYHSRWRIRTCFILKSQWHGQGSSMQQQSSLIHVTQPFFLFQGLALTILINNCPIFHAQGT